MMDNYDLWERHDRRQEASLKIRPVCDYCGHPIQDEHYFEINGDVMCEKCLEDNFMRSTEEYGE